jgi:hypothetical protein
MIYGSITLLLVTLNVIAAFQPRASGIDRRRVISCLPPTSLDMGLRMPLNYYHKLPRIPKIAPMAMSNGEKDSKSLVHTLKVRLQ